MPHVHAQMQRLTAKNRKGEIKLYEEHNFYTSSFVTENGLGCGSNTKSITNCNDNHNMVCTVLGTLKLFEVECNRKNQAAVSKRSRKYADVRKNKLANSPSCSLSSIQNLCLAMNKKYEIYRYQLNFLRLRKELSDALNVLQYLQPVDECLNNRQRIVQLSQMMLVLETCVKKA